MDSPQTEARVKQDQNDGNSIRVTSTPTFFVNGIPVVGLPDGKVSGIRDRLGARGKIGVGCRALEAMFEHTTMPSPMQGLGIATIAVCRSGRLVGDIHRDRIGAF